MSTACPLSIKFESTPLQVLHTASSCEAFSTYFEIKTALFNGLKLYICAVYYANLLKDRHLYYSKQTAGEYLRVLGVGQSNIQCSPNSCNFGS
jgi:hypothetical protein